MIAFMRYSLRNKEKIIEAIGEEKFNLLIKELNEKFQLQASVKDDNARQNRH